LNKALKINPKSAAANFNLGLLKANRKIFQKLSSTFERL